MIEVRMPSGPKQLRIKHFKSMAHVPEEGFDAAQDNLVFLAEFLDLNYNHMLDFRAKDIIKMTEIAVKCLARMDLKGKLPKEITLGHNKFTLVDPDKIGIGWHIDFQNCDINKDPVRLACLFYIPQGFNYSDIDENGNLLYPIDSRYEIFEKEFPLDLFIRCAGFFLRKSLISTKRLMVIEIAKKKATKKTSSLLKTLNLFNGKQQLRQ
jgi:hypothetical protein